MTLDNTRYIKRTLDAALETTRHAIVDYGAQARGVDYAAIRRRAQGRQALHRRALHRRAQGRLRGDMWQTSRATHPVRAHHPLRIVALAALLAVVLGFGLLYLNSGRGYTLQRAVDSSISGIFDAPALSNLDAAALQYLTVSR